MSSLAMFSCIELLIAERVHLNPAGTQCSTLLKSNTGLDSTVAISQVEKDNSYGKLGPNGGEIHLCVTSYMLLQFY